MSPTMTCVTSRRRLFFAPVLAALTLLTATACGGDSNTSAGEDGLTKVRYIQATDGLSYLPMFVAFGGDFFAEEGLEIDRQPNLANAAQLSQMAADGEVDIAGVGTTGAYSVAAAQRPLQGIGVLCPQNVFAMVLNKDVAEDLAADGVTPESPIEDRVQALEGLTLGVTPQGTLTDVLMRATLEEYGLDPDQDVTLQPLQEAASMLASARQGKIDGLLFTPPTPYSLVEQGGVEWINYAKGDVPATSGSYQLDLVASDDYVKDNKDTIEKFLRAVNRAEKLIQSDPDQAAGFARETFADLSEGLYQQSFDSVATAFTGLAPTEEGFERTLGLANQTVEDPIDLEFEDVYKTTFDAWSE
jgi:NitT/TauT family transport system substrate-binding protein